MNKPILKRRWFWVSFLASVILFLFGGYVFVETSAKWQLSALKSEDKKSGEITDLEAVDSLFQKAPKILRAEKEWIRALRSFQQKHFAVNCEIPEPNLTDQPDSPKSTQEKSLTLKRFAPEIKNACHLLKTAPGNSTFNSVNFTDPRIYYEEQILSRLQKQIASCLILQAEKQIRSGKTDQAIESISLCIAIADEIHLTPTLAHRFLEETTLGQMIRPAQRWIKKGIFNKKQIREIQKKIRPLGFRESLQKPLEINRLFTQRSVRKNRHASKFEKFKDSIFQTNNLLWLYQFQSIEIDSLSESWKESIENRNTLNQKRDRSVGIFDWLLVPAKSQFETYRKTPEGETEFLGLCEARKRAFLAFLSVAQYYQDHQTFPPNLRTLVPDYIDSVPIDPFTGRPLLYKKTKNGFVVWSTSRNQRNDGGMIDRNIQETLDIGFRWTLHSSINK